jgi:hypothetical protein
MLRMLIRRSQHVRTHCHQRKAFVVKCFAGALLRRCPCIAVMGMVPGSA